MPVFRNGSGQAQLYRSNVDFPSNQLQRPTILRTPSSEGDLRGPIEPTRGTLLTFTGTNGDPLPSPWVTVLFGSGGSATIQGNTARLRSPTNTYNGTCATYGATTPGDIDITTQLQIHPTLQEEYPAIGYRMAGGTNGWANPFGEVNNGYIAWFDVLANTLNWAVNTGGSSSTIISWPWVFVAGGTYYLRAKVTGSRHQVAMWRDDGSGQLAQGGWQIETTDATYSTGLWGIRQQANPAACDAFYDNLTFDDGTGGVVPVSDSVAVVGGGTLLAGPSVHVSSATMRGGGTGGGGASVATRISAARAVGGGTVLDRSSHVSAAAAVGGGTLRAGPTQHVSSARLVGGGAERAGPGTHVSSARTVGGGAETGGPGTHVSAARMVGGGEGRSGPGTHVSAAAVSGGGTVRPSAVHVSSARTVGGGTLMAADVHVSASRIVGGGSLVDLAVHVSATAIRGGGSLLAADVATRISSASLAGGGTLKSAAAHGITGNASIVGGGTLSAGPAVATRISSATMYGGGTAGGGGAPRATRVSSAAIAGGGVLGAVGRATRSSSARTVGGGRLIAGPQVPTRISSVRIVGGGSLATSSFAFRTSSARTVGGGTLLGAGVQDTGAVVTGPVALVVVDPQTGLSIVEVATSLVVVEDDVDSPLDRPAIFLEVVDPDGDLDV